MKHLTHIPVALALLLVLTGRSFGQDGQPKEIGPTVPQRLAPVGLKQKVLVIYVQADDYRIPPSKLAELNKAMDLKRTDASKWFRETTYEKLTLDMIPQRQDGGEWYQLRRGLFDYVHPTEALSMQARDPDSATTVHPTPAASVICRAAPATAGDRFDATDVGEYRYAVSTFRDGHESKLTKVENSVAIADGDAVTLTITSAASTDADRYFIFRKNKDKPDLDENYFRIGEGKVTGPVVTFIDRGIRMDGRGHFDRLVIEAMEAARADVQNYYSYKGVLVVIYAPRVRGQAVVAYTLGEGTDDQKVIDISAAFLASDSDLGRYTHEIGHWLELPDLYDSKTTDVIAKWDTMDCACDGQYQTWAKDYRLGYLANPANVIELRRPAPGKPAFEQDFIIHPTELNDTFSDRYTALKIKVSDTIHYYIEGRRRIAEKVSDQGIPTENILITEAIDALAMDIKPQRNVRHLQHLGPGTTFSPEPNDVVQITFTGINNQGTDDESYNVRIKLKARPLPDLRITPWSAPPWESPDIWVDSPRVGGGLQDPATATPLPGNGERPWVGEENRVWAKITNVGDRAANDVKVKFKVNSDPGCTENAGKFDDLKSPTEPVNLAPNQSKMVFAPWTPTADTNACIRVEIDRVADELDVNNNFAQEDTHNFYSREANPWLPVAISMEVTNPFPEPKRVDINVAGLPSGWRAKVEHGWVRLEPLARKTVEVVITPPPDAPECTEATLNVYAQTEIGDFIQPYSGFTPVIHLATPLKFRNSIDKLPSPNRTGGSPFIFWGCPTPAQPNTEIAIQLEGPAGDTTVVFVTTNAAGCFTRNVTFPYAGDWNLRTYFAGSKCNAPTESGPTPVTITPGDVAQKGSPRGLWYSFHLGHNFPIGSLRNTNNSGSSVTASFEYAFRDNLSLNYMLGYHYFNSRNAGVRDLSYTNISANTRTYFPVSTWRSYVQAGFGVYIPNFGPTKLGLNFGTGLNFTIQPKLVLELGTDFHFVDPGGANRVFADPRLGIKFRF